MDELDALKAISEKLEKLSTDERDRVLAWLNAKFGSGAGTAVHPSMSSNPTSSPTSAPKSKSIQKSGKRPKIKSIISMDKSLNLSPSGKKSAAQFASEKTPSNVMQKCVVAVYYLRDVLELDKITVSAVYTFFKTLGWPIPSDLKNTLQQAGSKGWLDTADAEEIKVTSMGENLIEHGLPAKAAR
ncbi:hypothetical protein [Sphingomonas flavescens]|uniref:hypothetical protein n=1 Tax=Sphingomonas flavescens TaxID=3132797 RepID=UPI002804C9EB|nr:hypothetical protein [Sphingomonas limnosediminicola]